MTKYLALFLLIGSAVGQQLNGAIPMSVPNGAGGTAYQSLAIISGDQATTALTTSTTVPLYLVISATSATGNALLAGVGVGECLAFDSNFSATPGTPAYVIASVTNPGQCRAANAPLANGTGYAGILLSGSTSSGQPALIMVQPGVWQGGSGGGGGAPTGPCGGDLAGSYPNCTVTNGSNITNGSILNSALANPSLTLNGQTVALGASGTIPFQTNGSGNSSQAGINLSTSTTNTDGLIVTPTNSATNVEKFEITGPMTMTSGGTIPSGQTFTVNPGATFTCNGTCPTQLPNINKVTVSGITNTYTDTTFGAALLDAIIAQTGLHTFDGSGFAGTQTWNTSGYLGVGGTGHIILPCSAINLSDSITMALRTGLYGCNPEGTNFNVQNTFPTKPTGGTVSTQNAASGSCAGNCVLGAGTSFVAGMSSIVIAGTPYSVVSVQGSTLLTLATAPGSSSGQSYTADQPVITWGPGSTFAAPLSNFQVNCGVGYADIGVNNAGSQENSSTTNVRVQDCPVANFQLSNTDGSINSHVQNVYMTNLNSIYINAPCTANTRAFKSNTNGGGVYIDKATFVLGNGVGGCGTNSDVSPTAVAEVNGPILATDWHVEGNGSNLSSNIFLIAVGLTNAGNSHNDTFINTKFATANANSSCGFHISNGVTDFMAINPDGGGSGLSNLICDVGNSNTITLANNPKLSRYWLDNNGNAWMEGGNCSDMTNGFCMGQSSTVWEYVVSGTVVAQVTTAGIAAFASATLNSNQAVSMEGTPTVNNAACWKTNTTPPTLGYCSSVNAGTGACVCN